MAAGKITGPGGAPPSDLPAAAKDDAPGAARGARFADKLGSAPPPARAAEATGTTSDLAAQLGAGKITAKAAIDKVIDRVVDRQVGVNAPAAVREKVRAALESAVADDPLLSEKIKTLGA